MKKFPPLLFLLSLYLIFPSCQSTFSPRDLSVQWKTEWTITLFEKAEKEGKLVLLDLGASWCHWCHVMDKKTYSHPEVIKILNDSYISVQIDQDARPDLANRYEDYGWPATIIFDSQGREIVKKRGYLPPSQMVSLLKACIEDPAPVVQPPEAPQDFTDRPHLSKEIARKLTNRYFSSYDSKKGGWGQGNKFLDWDSLEYALKLAREGNKKAEKMARQTLDRGLQLIDPVWGGVYQYSTGGGWREIHYEKLMSFQAENLRLYSLAYLQWKDPKYLKAAHEIYRYMTDFLLSPEGAFYASQDADLIRGEHSGDYFALKDKERRARGIPRIDKNRYSRENGWAIRGLCHYYTVTEKRRVLEQALQAARWVMENRSVKKGGYGHGKKDKEGSYLGDTLAMGRAFLALHMVTGKRKWLKKAKEAAQFLNCKFKWKGKMGKGAGYITAPLPEKARGSFQVPKFQLEENINVARLANLLFHYTGEKKYRQMAEWAMAYLATPEVATRRRIWVAGILLANRELSRPPLHITVLGPKGKIQSRKLFLAALKAPTGYKRIEWWDKSQGPLPNRDVSFPALKKPAAFICTQNSCSSPLETPEKVLERIGER